MNPDEIVICTIISKNYLAHARTLTESFLKHNPNGKIFVLLVDEVNDHFDPKKEKFILVDVKQIGIKNLDSFCFKYSILEQNTGVKANFLKYLFKKYHLKKLAYFDPDILFSNNIKNLWSLLDRKSIVLTPHITSPILDEKKPSEYDIMKSGVFNLGFIALSYNETTKNFLDWWSSHLMEHGYSDIQRGMFTDQKWVDLVPSIFDDVYIIRHPGYNVAYWNLMQREVMIQDKKIFVNSKPVYFFHFSGFSPEAMENVSKHQNRFTIKDLEKIRPLFDLYSDLLVENDYLKIKKWKCKFDYFDNGVQIPQLARRIYSDTIKEGLNFGNPFRTSETNSFLDYLNENVDGQEPVITRLWNQIFKEREDLEESFPDPLGRDRQKFVKWINGSVEQEYKLDPVFLKPLTETFGTSEKISKIKHSTKSTFRKKILAQDIVQNKKLGNEIGINVSGYFRGEFGIGEEVRNFVKALKSVEVPNVLNNITANNHRWDDNTFQKFEEKNLYPINLIVVNADQVEVVYKQFGSKYFQNKFNIGAWAWELPNFPSKWFSNFQYFDEIWTLSSFMADSISKISPVPVIKMTYPLEIDEKKLINNKSKFSLKKNNFVFLFIFDFYSIFQRKNPISTIDAFKKAFSENDNVTLIIKCINGSQFPSEFKKMMQSCNRKNIRVISDHLNKDEILSLLASSDSYISLHRSEGVGLTIAEAMIAGKPVIATAYGGNNDFMNLNNSFPIKYEKVELERDYGPYTKGNTWAEPDIDHAASQMKYIYENPDYAKKIGQIASSEIKKKMNPKVTGMEILNRIKTLSHLENFSVVKR